MGHLAQKLAFSRVDDPTHRSFARNVIQPELQHNLFTLNDVAGLQQEIRANGTPGGEIEFSGTYSPCMFFRQARHDPDGTGQAQVGLKDFIYFPCHMRILSHAQAFCLGNSQVRQIIPVRASFRKFLPGKGDGWHQ